MGGFSGFISGITLTSAALYLSLAVHQRNRASQSAALRQQSLILNSLVESDLIPPEPRPRFIEARPSWSEVWKDRWNADVERMVRWCHELRWDDVRAPAEGMVRGLREQSKKS